MREAFRDAHRRGTRARFPRRHHHDEFPERLRHARREMTRGHRGRGRVPRGDVRTAVLLLLADEPMHGYQLMQAIADRTGGRWQPSPGAIYPTISQLEDEGLLTLTAGGTYTIFVRTDANVTATGTYSFRIHRVAPAQTFSLALDETVANGTIGGFAQPGAGNIEAVQSQDVYNLTGIAPGLRGTCRLAGGARVGAACHQGGQAEGAQRAVGKRQYGHHDSSR